LGQIGTVEEFVGAIGGGRRYMIRHGDSRLGKIGIIHVTRLLWKHGKGAFPEEYDFAVHGLIEGRNEPPTILGHVVHGAITEALVSFENGGRILILHGNP
jgi:hypothetical protein